MPITPASESGESPSLAAPKETAFPFTDTNNELELFEPTELDAAETEAVTRKASV